VFWNTSIEGNAPSETGPKGDPDPGMTIGLVVGGPKMFNPTPEFPDEGGGITDPPSDAFRTGANGPGISQFGVICVPMGGIFVIGTWVVGNRLMIEAFVKEGGVV